MDRRQIRDSLNALDGRWATPERIKVLSELSPLYRRNGVIRDGFAPSLQESCPDRFRCWAQAQDRLQPVVAAHCGHGQNASIAWPWVGDQYERPGGLCLVALNINSAEAVWWAAPTEEYAIAGHVIDGLGEGRKQIWRGSSFHYRAMASALAILTSADGAEPTIAPAPQEAATAMQRVARVQAVKCSPLKDRSYPTKDMQDNCPPRFAQHELSVLQPGSLLALGVEARIAVELLGDVSWARPRSGFLRGSIRIKGRTSEVFVVPHPNSWGSHWPRAQAALVRSLKSRPASECVPA
jgi:hypothetical protein